MARMRTVKPEYWTDEDLAELPRDARLLYIGLWNLADEHARLRGRPDYIKGQLFPYDDDMDALAIAGLIKVLADAGKIEPYAIEGRSYLYLPNLGAHQRLEPDRVPSRLPAPLSTPSSVPRADEPAPNADTSESYAKDHALSRQHVAGSMEQQHARERAPAAAVRFVLEALDDATEAEAEAVAQWVLEQRKPRNLVPLLRTIAQAGELPDVLAAVRAERVKSAAVDVLAQARASPECEHRVAGGGLPHPSTGEPLCPLCRKAAT